MKRFRIGEPPGPTKDCTVDGDAVTCTSTWDQPYQLDAFSGGFTGTLSGVTMTGTVTSRESGHDADDPGCRWVMETSAPITYTFSPDGTVRSVQNVGQWTKTSSGSCSGTESGRDPSGAVSAPQPWIKVE